MTIYKLTFGDAWWGTHIYRTKSSAKAAYNEAFKYANGYKMLSYEIPDDPSDWVDTMWDKCVITD